MSPRAEPVHRATTREEREAIYRFRYSVYFEEFGRELGSPDHERHWVRDEDDDADFTTLLYTGTPERITGALRLRHWRAGEVPHHDFEELSMGRFPGIERLNTGELGRLMVRRSDRGSAILSSLIAEAYRILAGEQETDVAFIYCSPGLVALYQRFGLRPYGGAIVAAPDGVMIPLASVLCDYRHHRRVGSFLAPLVRQHFGPGRRQPIELAPFEEIFTAGERTLESDPERILARIEGAIDRAQACDGSGTGSFLAGVSPEAMAELARQAFIVDVPAGTVVTREGFHETEMYAVLEGEFETVSGRRFLGHSRCGDLMGEDAFFSPGGRRTATIRAATDGSVLVLIGRAVDRLIRRRPVAASLLLLQLGTVLASRLHRSTATLGGRGT